MALGVFVHRTAPSDQKRPTEHYHFSAECLPLASKCLDDWVLLYEPVRMKEARGYYAMAHVRKIVRDPVILGRCLAVFEPGSYLEFAEPVPLARSKAGTMNDPSGNVGRNQTDVRPISSIDFLRIIEMGYGQQDFGTQDFLAAGIPDVAEDPAPSPFDTDRERIAYYNQRLVRDRIFRTLVIRHYSDRCAISGLRFADSTGQSEAVAAHIVPVKACGSDSILNGLALTRTVHWLFDAGMLSLTDDLGILVAKPRPGYDDPRSIVNSTGRLLLSPRATTRPQSRFLQWHRDHCYRG